MFCTKCGGQIPDGQSFCPNCGAQNGGSGIQPDMPMAWYKFLIYFALFAGAVINAISGIMYLTGSIYESTAGVPASLVYVFYGSLKIVDVIYGIAAIGLAVIAVLTRMKLAAYSADGPKLVLALYALGVIVSVVYALLVSMITKQNGFTGSVLISIVVSVIMIFANKAYFDKRAHLFVN